MKNVTSEELILEFMPFPDVLLAWCKSHREFLVALKNVYPEKFISPAMVMTSTSPNYPGDEVIGVYSYHYQIKKPIFKQDFIINKGRKNKEFVLYTRNFKSGSSKYVKDIHEFFETYGKGGYYVGSHHLSLDELPEELQERAKETIRLANKMKETDLSMLTRDHIDEIYEQVRLLKKGEWVTWQKMKNKSKLPTTKSQP